jgi:mannose-6-phosphate isomerase
MDRERQRCVVNEVVTCAERYSNTDQTFELVIRLNSEYPGDIGVLSPILLNVVQLNPGEAIHIPAGELHAYLEGAGLELMANSDNVLRGGLTPKYVDVPELLKILDFQYHEVEILRPERQETGEHIYPIVSDEFILSVISLDEGSFYESPQKRSVEIMICIEGGAHITDLGSNEILELSQGTSIIIPAAVKQYRLEGVSTVYKAAVPL